MFSSYRSNQILSPQSLFTQSGQRKYLNAAERRRFLATTKLQSEPTQLFCQLLFNSGCRISEALNLTSECILVSEGVVLICSLKKRGIIAIRQVPIPPELLIRIKASSSTNPQGKLWCWGRTWAWTQIKETMTLAQIEGPHATPRGLRHGFGVHAIQNGVPLNMVQRWLGHADIRTTAIYTNAVGPEEQALAMRMWSDR